MQIPENPFVSGLGFLKQTQAGGHRPINPEIQTKAKVNAKVPAAAPSRAETLGQAVRALSDQGPLPPRGSLIDLKA